MIGKRGISQIIVVILWIASASIFFMTTWWCLFISTYPGEKLWAWWLIILLTLLFGTPLAHLGIASWGDDL
jgi:ABC-type multidrug transport system permease subunit